MSWLLGGVSKSVQILVSGIGAVVVLTLIILKSRALFEGALKVVVRLVEG